MECPSCHARISGSLSRCPACATPLPEPVHTLVHEREFEVLDGKWLLEQKLGQGGMGTVYLARDLGLDRRVAVKMMSLSHADNAELVTRFEREARMMARLDHPHVVPVYAVGRKDKSPYIVMKYLEGQSLADYLADRGPLPLGEVLSICQQAGEGLQFIHDQGVVHRDVKPANLFVSPQGHVTVLDLGVAHDTQNVMTRSGVIVGTPKYMAPEQVLGKHVDARADLYAFGTVLFEMLTGKPVFDRGSDYSIMKAHIDEAPPDPRSLVDVPAAVTPVVQRVLAKAPEDRYPSATALVEALTEALGPGVRPVRPRPTVRGVATPAPVTPRPAGAVAGGAARPPGDEAARQRPAISSGEVPAPATPSTRAAPPSRPPTLPTVPPEAVRDLQESSGTDARHASEAPAAARASEPAQGDASSVERNEARLSTEERAAVRPRRRGLALGLAGAVAGLLVVGVLVFRPWADDEALQQARRDAEQAAAVAHASATANTGAPARPERVTPSDPARTPSGATVEPGAASEPTHDATAPRANPEPRPAVPSAAGSAPSPRERPPSSGTAPDSAPSPSAAATRSPHRAATGVSGPRTPGASPATPVPRDVAVSASAEPAASSNVPPSPATGLAELRLVVTTQGGLSWAYVDVDGLRQGATPLTVRVEAGTHTLAFRREGFRLEVRELTVTPGETRKVTVELSPTAPPKPPSGS